MEILSFLAGTLLPVLIMAILSKINPNAVAKLFSEWLSYIVKDEEARNKIENSVGDELIAIGKAIKNITPDDTGL